MKWRILAGLCFIMVGCEKKIDIRITNNEQKTVVEATIENDQPPMVILTRSIGYFSALTPQAVSQSFIHGAQITISNGTLTHQLKEYSLPLGPGITGYFYSIDSSSLATAFVGELNKTYQLRILAEGQEYNATTTIPKITKRVDSLWWKTAPGNDDTSKVVVMVKVTDPPGYGDYIRYFTRINQQRTWLPPSNSVFNDLFIDGTSYEVQLQPGINRNMDRDSIEYDFFSKGDTVQFKLSNIDKTTYDFWQTWESAFSSVGNPFSTPTRILGNISNHALGYFGGYASQYRTLIIPQ